MSSDRLSHGPDSAEPGRSSYDLDDPCVFAAAQEFLAAVEAGHAPSRSDFLERYPEIAPALADCLDGLEFLHQAVPVDPPELANHASLEAGIAECLGDFRLVREIGRGGMGVVYEALQRSLGRRVAVKVLPFAAAIDDRQLQRFKNEAQAAAQLHHSNIVPVYAVGVERGVHFYAMQLIEGVSLGDLIRYLRRPATGPVPADATACAAMAGSVARSTGLIAADAMRCDHFRKASELVRQAALALEYAHEFGVIHRDIKPANLLVDARGNLWVTDFGLAQIRTDATLTRSGDVLGTMRYMSPEQASGNRAAVDHRADIYSLGVTFYELLTLEPVFAESDRVQLARRILEDDPRPPCSLDRSIPVELETIVLKAISKVPAQRYATAQDLADDLQRWLDDRPIAARRPTVKQRAARWARRHRYFVRTAAAFLLLAVLGLAVSATMVLREQAETKAAYRRESEQRTVAEQSFRQAREAVGTFTQLSEEELAADPRMQPLRRKFLEAALKYYSDFVAERRDDPSVRDDLAASSQRVAQLLEELAALEGFGRFLLLSDSRVRQDLAATPFQCERLDALLSEWTQERKQAGTEGLPGRKQIQLGNLLLSYENQLRAVLDAKQLQRLKQIGWQQQTPTVFRTTEIADLLQLTAEQRRQIDFIMAEEGRGIRQRSADSHRPPPPSSSPGSRQAVRETEDRATKRILAALTPEQRSKWNELIGRPFAHDLHRGPEQWIAH